MVEGHGGKHPHINDIIQELEDDNLWNRMDSRLREKALNAIGPSSEDSNFAHPECSAPRSEYEANAPILTNNTELEDDNLREPNGQALREKAMTLTAIGQSFKDPSFAHPGIVLPQGLGHGGKHPHTNDITRESEDDNLRNRMARDKLSSTSGKKQ